MKKNVLMLMTLVGGGLAVQAEDSYTYLTFETTDGAKVSMSVSSLPVTINLDNSTLAIGNETFALADLSKMYFSTQSETTGIETIDNGQSTMDNSAEFYDLQGHKVTKAQMKKGVYIVKTNSKTYKIVVK